MVDNTFTYPSVDYIFTGPVSAEEWPGKALVPRHYLVRSNQLTTAHHVDTRERRALRGVGESSAYDDRNGRQCRISNTVRRSINFNGVSQQTSPRRIRVQLSNGYHDHTDGSYPHCW